MTEPMTILVTNDDGAGAPGLEELRRVAADFGKVLVVAPDRDQSGTSHSLSLRAPLRTETLEPGVIQLAGTPTDCVLVAVNGLLPRPPDLLLSGINRGPNLGEDVVYSGTVAAAFEGNILGIPSVAVSLAAKRADASFETSGAFMRRLIEFLVTRETLEPDLLLNVNVPSLPSGEIGGVRITQLGTRVYENAVVRDKDEEGRDCFFIWGGEPTWTPKENCDYGAIADGFISVTPLHQDLTHYKRMVELEGWSLPWES
jgi:5'-nucleotidase